MGKTVRSGLAVWTRQGAFVSLQWAALALLVSQNPLKRIKG